MGKEMLLKEHSLFNDPKFADSFRGIQFDNFITVPRDGNCFYSAVAYGISNLIQNKQGFLESFLSYDEDFKKLNIEPCVYETYIEYLRENPELNEESFMVFVGYLRLICATYIRLNKSKFEGFVVEGLENYVIKNIDTMNTRADNLEISAMSFALNVNIVIYDITNPGLNIKDFGDGDKINILFTPDHFEYLL